LGENESRLLFWTWFHWETRDLQQDTKYGATGVALTPHWNCRTTTANRYKISVTGYEYIGGVRYDQVPDPLETP
jgi:hypothetical protein